MELEKILEKEARQMGAAYFGIADLSRTKGGAITPHEAELVAEYPIAISVGVALNPSVVDGIGNQTDVFALHTYHHYIYEVVNRLIDQITLHLGSILSEKYRALPVPASLRIDQDHLYAAFSHKIAASLAGVGWIGKSCLLITPDRGPRLRLGTLLTYAHLTAGNPVKEGCGKCNACADGCPARAIIGKNFVPTEPRESRLMAQRCDEYCSENEKKLGKRACGFCVYICPFGFTKGTG
jgi:epoxyqueuosine reductase